MEWRSAYSSTDAICLQQRFAIAFNTSASRSPYSSTSLSPLTPALRYRIRSRPSNI
ncbi:hypothetical protein NWP22_14240 [Anabaenopsis tanganyikae CS-531]|uniref:Uncharacterized protein n=2 Tax=Anabaenopsis TaxID=110103 RepID=A0ABT5ATL6_9CYAN|nr:MULTISPECIES: hypothetical protein [Anabaenopsis]MDB9540272.1 hypothetical protein [Anabaenopsis arnoldii]MDH6092671.1 hypothetical protein [Anabaenopsis arnoldii]MDH6107012.1 hypothetical protein [Anabaenopsis tanganyikae CS-531]